MATREIFWNIGVSDELVFYVLAAIALLIFGYGVYRHGRRILQGVASPFSVSPGRLKIWGVLADLAINRSLFRKHPLAGVMHLCIMWGMVILFVGTIIIAVEYDLFHKILGMTGVLQGSFFKGFELVLDVFGALLLLGLAAALIRRYAIRPPQLKRQFIDWAVPVWLVFIVATGFLVEALRLSAFSGRLPYDPAWSPVGAALAPLFGDMDVDTVRVWHAAMWWFHGFAALLGIAALPFAPKVVHVLSAWVNAALREMRPRGRLAPLDVEGAFERDEILGYDTLSHLSKKDLLDVSACTECGRCELNCPANISGKILSPREVVLGLRRQLNEERPLTGTPPASRRILDGFVEAEAITYCTTCMACVEACPAFVDPLGKILEIRRCEVMIQDEFPDTYADVFAGVEKRGNPWNEHPTARMDWAKGLTVKTMAEAAEAGETVEYLFWVGCAAAFDPRNQKIARSMAAILDAAGVSFAVLGEEERCTGDPARRMGHEYLFQIQAESNVELLNGYHFEKILTICPHCYNTFTKEYPDYGGVYTVVHHTELIRELLLEKRISLTTPVEKTMVYHDSCYLGRHNRIFDAPRRVLEQIPGVKMTEMEKSRAFGMCCGAGGGLTWYEEDADKRVNDRRVEQAEAALSDASPGAPGVIATACPFCMTMIEDGLAAKDTGMADMDIAEITAHAMGLAP